MVRPQFWSRLIMTLGFMLLIAVAHPPHTAQAAERCFAETGFCIDGRIREFWEQNGGLPVFGFPIAPQETATVDGVAITVQRFERNRLELHPENPAPYDVLLGRLGADRLTQQRRDWFTFPKSTDSGGCLSFAETGHAVCGSILNAWQSNGLQIDGNRAVSYAESLALFGLPLSGLVTETLADGQQYQVQWFERARFELHPENAAPYDVLLGLLGNELAQPAPTTVSCTSPYKPLPELLFPANRFAEIGYQTLFDDKPTWYVIPSKAEEVCGSENADPWDPSKAFMVTYNDPQYLRYVTQLSNGYVVSIQMQDTDTLDYARGFFNLYVGSFKNDRTSEYQYQLDSEQNIQGCRIMRYNRFSDVLWYDSRGLLITCGTLTTIYQITPYGNSEQSVEQLMSLFLQHALNHFTEPQYVY